MIMKTDMDDAFIGTCANCHTADVWVRRIQSQHSEFMGGGRGHFNIGFCCLGPVRIWYKGPARMKSPLNWSKEKITKYLEERR